MNFDLSTRSGRCRARKAGFDVPKQKPGPKQKAFADFVKMVGDCEIWQGEPNKDGYGRYHVDGKTVAAHRYAWELVNGPIPDGVLLMHSCDNPACVKVKHLSPGGHTENQADKFAKDRQAKGEVVGTSKLTEDQVQQIRSRIGRGEKQKALAQEFSVHRDTIRKAVNGTYWRHLA
jgi:hypothetical protein